MSYAEQRYYMDFAHVKSPDMQRVLAAGIPAFIYLQDLAAPSVAVHAAVEEGAANAFPGAFTSPAHPKNVQCVFAAGWQGGDITITGTDQFGRAQTETIADTPGSTVQGVKIWRTITAIAKESVAGTTDTVTVQTGTKIGLTLPLKYAWGIGMVAGVAEAMTFDATYHGVTPGTAPDGSKDFLFLLPVDWAVARMLNLF